MRYQRCQCGACEWFGSDPPPLCDFCNKCGSGPGSSPTTHREPLPHDFASVETIQTDQGDATITRCRYCRKTRQQIEKRAKAAAETG